MVCEKCGTEIGKGLKFCTKCGSKGTKCGSKVIDIAPGKKLLIVTGILFIIIYSVIGVSFLLLISFSLGTSKLNFTLSLGTVVFIIVIIGGILPVIAGIFGIKYSKNIEKAKLLLCFAIMIIIFQIILLIISLIYDYSMNKPFNEGRIIVCFIGFILPICFLIGAYMNLKSEGGK